MLLFPRIIVSKSHENTSEYVDTVTLFSKTWTKGHWSLDDLWPHICWGHMCDFTQGSLCPSPVGIHQCMRMQWLILQNFNQDYHILHTPYYVHTTYSRMSDHIVSFWTKFRRGTEVRYFQTMVIAFHLLVLLILVKWIFQHVQTKIFPNDRPYIFSMLRQYDIFS